MFSKSRERVLVIGLGKSGRAATLALRRCGARVIATDEKPREALAPAVAELEAAGATFVEPAELNGAIRESTLAVISPGVPPTSQLVQRLRAAEIPLIGEIELAYRLSRSPIAAVTGTKGKSTTSALLGHMLRVGGSEVRVGGNIGNPLVGEVADAPEHAWLVAEVSSFQLESIVRFRPRIAVLLNILADHLDRYASIEEYAEAKFRIFENQGEGDTIVLDLDDARLAALRGRIRRFHPDLREFWYTLRDPRDERASLWMHGERVFYDAGMDSPEVVFGTGDLSLVGEHNLRNAMAAAAAAIAAGCDVASIRKALNTFEPLAHRLQPICEIDGVLFVDDSKATNPAAAMAALQSYSRPVILIAGGRAKGTDFSELGAMIRSHAKLLVVVGESAAEIAAAASPLATERASSMQDAVSRARRHARSGDVVLLSPACASFDMFASAEDRGERFAHAARTYLEPAGAK